MSTQYNAIGTKYNQIHTLPAAVPERDSVTNALGSVKDLRCLDLACGTGRYSRLLIELGASSVVGVDISSAMVDGAKAASAGDERLSFAVGDCSVPTKLYSETDGEGPFDLVFAGWFLNYAPDYATLVNMWRNVVLNLKPGGRFVCLSPNLRLDPRQGLHAKYGILLEAVHRVEGGWKARCIAPSADVQFDFFLLEKDVYEKAAKEAGMVDLQWSPAVITDEVEKQFEPGFLDEMKERPFHEVIVARKPE